MSNKVRFIALSVVLVLLVLLGFDMNRLANARDFWGIRPMFFLLLLTAFITLVRNRFFYGNGWRIRWTVMSTKLDQYWELTWTWLTLGNALAEYPSWAQWYSFTGVFGGTFWILLINYIVFQLLVKHKIWGLNLKRMLIPAAVIVVPILISQV